MSEEWLRLNVIRWARRKSIAGLDHRLERDGVSRATLSHDQMDRILRASIAGSLWSACLVGAVIGAGLYYVARAIGGGAGRPVFFLGFLAIIWPSAAMIVFQTLFSASRPSRRYESFVLETMDSRRIASVSLFAEPVLAVIGAVIATIVAS